MTAEELDDDSDDDGDDDEADEGNRRRWSPRAVVQLSSCSKMVYYFTSNTVTPAAFIYVGKDKVES